MHARENRLFLIGFSFACTALYKCMFIDMHINISILNNNSFFLEQLNLHNSFLAQFQAADVAGFADNSSPAAGRPFVTGHAGKQKSDNFGGYVSFEFITYTTCQNAIR